MLEVLALIKIFDFGIFRCERHSSSMSTIYDPRYISLINHLVSLRKKAGITQEAVASALTLDQSTVSKVEAFERRLDVIELQDWLEVLGCDRRTFLQDIGWLSEEIDPSRPAIPVPGKAHEKVVNGTFIGTVIEMAWQGHKKEVLIEGLPVRGYLKLESNIAQIIKKLNDRDGGKNRDAIHKALEAAFTKFPNVNPSDLYHHVVYRVYLREYTKTQPDRSWVRAGGEAFELFLEKHYNSILKSQGIRVKWLSNDALRLAALSEMGLQSEVGGSKLDIALYGMLGKKEFIFGGIHAKASLAERVSDDVPCSVAMMKKGFSSYLVTLDAKSFPPPKGDLVNRGELGSLSAPSDKRAYIESHGSFDACFSYNLRTIPSPTSTKSGKLIHVSTFHHQKDPLPAIVASAWSAFSQKLAP